VRHAREEVEEFQGNRFQRNREVRNFLEKSDDLFL
jgi:hypothetical protein